MLLECSSNQSECGNCLYRAAIRVAKHSMGVTSASITSKDRSKCHANVVTATFFRGSQHPKQETNLLKITTP